MYSTGAKPQSEDGPEIHESCESPVGGREQGTNVPSEREGEELHEDRNMTPVQSTPRFEDYEGNEGQCDKSDVQEFNHSLSLVPYPETSTSKGESKPIFPRGSDTLLSDFFKKTLKVSSTEHIMEALINTSEGVVASKIKSADILQEDMPTFPALEEFLGALLDERKSNQYIFRLYRRLPPPGVTHLSKNSRGELLRRFASSPDRRRVNARRYLALVDDMIDAGLPMSRALWTSAMYFTAHTSHRAEKSDLRNAIGLWRQMERVAGIESDSGVFDVLFHVSLKAGQYTVADRFLTEMESRGVNFSRHGKVTNIYYQGLKKDVDGIRKAFDEFIQSGELVDTVVLNCLLASLLRAGDSQAADQLYRRMMQNQEQSEKPVRRAKNHLHHFPSLSSEFSLYRKQAKKVGWVLSKSAALQTQSPALHKLLQEAVPQGPDTRTFHILLAHHCKHTGDLATIMNILEDMENVFPIPPRFLVFHFLFDGFANHSRRAKGWTPQRLLDTWNTFRRALLESHARVVNRNRPHGANPRWENPLELSRDILLEPVLDDIYTPLPSGQPQERNDETENNPAGGDKQAKDEAEAEGKALEDAMADGDEVADMFSETSRRRLIYDPDLGESPPRIENGVFLSRRIIISILRAFGSCCEPQVLMDVWLQIDSFWQSDYRSPLDVFAVKEELTKQLEKSRRIHQGGW